MLDYINILGLEVYAYHGVDEERALGQVYVIDLRIGTDTQPAGFKDSLEYSLHYGELCLRVTRVFKAENYETMEACAEVIAQYLLTEYDEIVDIGVRVRKTSNRIEERTSEISVEVYRKKTRVFINICAMNQNSEERIEYALNKIKENKYLRLFKESYIYERENEQGDAIFKNQVIEIGSLLKPIELNSFLNEISAEVNDKIDDYTQHNLSLDILFYGDEVIHSDDLIVPNPFIEERLTVLEGLNELSPYFIHPVNKKQIRHLKDELELKLNFFED